MPQNSDEKDPLWNLVRQFKTKVHLLDNSFGPTEIYQRMQQLSTIINGIDTTKCSEQILNEFFDRNMETIVNKTSKSVYVIEEKLTLNKVLIQMIIKKLIEVFSVNKGYQLSLRALKGIMTKKQNVLFFHQQKQSPNKNAMAGAYYRERDDYDPVPTQFYIQCVGTIREEFTTFVKEVWNMTLSDFTDLIQFLGFLEKSKEQKTYMTALFESFFTQFTAFIQSGRKQLLMFANYQKLVHLSNYFSRSTENIIKKQQIESIIPILSKSLIIKGGEQRLAGIKLLNKLCKKLNDYMYYSENQRMKELLNKLDIFTYIINKQFTEEQNNDANYIFKFFSKSNTNKEKTINMLKLLRENKNENRWLIKFCLKELYVYSMNIQQKQMIIKYLEEQTNLSDCYAQYSECIDDLLYRHDLPDPLNQRLFKLLQGLITDTYTSLYEMHQRKLLSNFKSAAKGLRVILTKQNQENRIQYLKNYAKNLLEQMKVTSIIIFNIVFQESEVFRCFSNNQYQGIMNYVVEDLNIFSKIFQFLQQNDKVNDIYKQIVQIIRYTSSKCNIKVDVTEKYIKVLAKFPQLYESLIGSEGYNKVRTQMEKVLDLFRSEPNIPFHILKTTFVKANFKKFSDYNKKPSLLNNRVEEYILKSPPSSLQFYQQLISLLQETNSKQLRSQIAQFVVILHINYDSSDNDEVLIKYIDSVLEYFEENTKNYIAKKASKNSVLANFQLITQILQATDILGVGKYKPHNSLVSTSTISLTILNNATFGDDVQKSVVRNFPSNMVLFDLLASVSLAFKCGPQDLVLRQGDRFFAIIYNGKMLQDLQLTNEEIIAERNQSNFTKAPELYKGKGSKKDELSPIYMKCLTQIFNRFAFQGKMGQIECMNYMRQVSDSYVSPSDRRIKQLMDDYDKDNDGILTFDDFLAYSTKRLGDQYYAYYAQQFKKGLHNLRYRKNMTLSGEPLDISDRYNLMMRFRIEKASQIYEELFKYTGDEDFDVSQKAKQLLFNLPTCPAMKKNMNQIFDFSNNSQFLLYYKLVLIESELSQHNPSISIQEYKKQKSFKILQFSHNKYNEVIFNLMKIFYQKINQSLFFYKCFTICLKILRSLVDIDNLISTNISKLRFTPQSIHQLPNAPFLAEEALKALKAKNIINFEVLLVLELTQSYVQISPIIQGCFNDDEQIRRICCNFIYLWEEKISWKDNLFEINIVQSNFIQWFELLCVIIERTNKCDLQKILYHTISILEKREETLYNRYDKLMYGYLKILKTIIQKDSKCLREPKLNQIISKLLNKAISQQNRGLLYDILLYLNDDLILGYIGHMLSTILPSQQCQVRTKYVGVKNLGAICYINSILQQFFMIQKFRYMILNRKVPTDCKMVEVNGKPIVDDFMYQLQKMYQNLQTSQKKYYVPKDFCYSYKDFDGKPINTSIQQDSHEFLNRLIQNVEQACKKDENLQQLQRICEIKTLTEYQCGQCKNRIDKIQNHYSCMLQVKEQDSLASSLKKFTQKEQIQGYTCDNCKKKVKKITKRTFFNELPEIVILNLQRIIFDQKKNDKIKVHSRLEFPMEINFQQYMKHSNVQNMQTKYRLKGVVIHTGTSEGGHYYSLIRNNNVDGWLKFNDQNVVEFEQKQISREGFGGFEQKDNHFEEVTYSTNAYILFYQNVDAKQKQFLQVENNLSQQVQTENHKLIQQIQIHQQCFFVAIDKLYQKYKLQNKELFNNPSKSQRSMINQKDKEIFSKILEIHQKAIKFLSVFTALKAEIKTKIGINILELYNLMPQQSVRFFKQLNIDTFSQNIISHNDQTYRQSLKNIFTTNLISYINYCGIDFSQQKEESMLIINLINNLLLFLQSTTLYSNLAKSSIYFALISDIIHYNEGLKYYLIGQQIMFKLLDVIMGRESTYMKYHPKAQDLPKDAVFAIFKIISQLLPYKKTIKGVFLKNYKVKLFETTAMQAKIIMSPVFYRRIFRLNYNHQLLSSLIYHYSIQDLDYTIMIADILVQQMNKADQGDHHLLFKHINTFISINDKLQEIRYSFIFGFPQYCQVKPQLFCLSMSDRSDNTCYVSGVYPNKDEKHKFDKFESDRKPLLQLIFGQKYLRNHMLNLAYYGLKLLVSLSEGFQQAFEYLIRIPPPNYYKKTIFDLIPQITTKLLEEQDFIIEGKLQNITIINSLYQSIQEKIKILDAKLPIKRYIIGKNKHTQQVSKLDQQFYLCTFRRCDTYILQNVPLGSENKSMAKNFHYQAKGISNLFIDSRLNSNYSDQKADVKPTVYILKGKTKHKVILRFNNSTFNYTVILTDDDFNINMPYYKEGNILDFVNFELYKQVQHEVSAQQLGLVFKIKQEEPMKEEPKAGGQMVGEKVQMEDGKLACPQCTYLNDLTAQKCQVCQNFLYL